MLHKSKSKKINQLKYALVIPVLLGFLISCNSEVSDPTPESKVLKSNADGKPSPIIIKGHPANGLYPLFIVDGKETPHDEYYKLNEDDFFSVSVLKDENVIKKYGDKAKNGVVEIITKENANSFEGKPMSDIKVIADNVEVVGAKSDSNVKIGHKIEVGKDEHPLVVIDGKELPYEDIVRLDSDKVETMTFLKAETATKKYGDKGKNGVIEIITKM